MQKLAQHSTFKQKEKVQAMSASVILLVIPHEIKKRMFKPL